MIDIHSHTNYSDGSFTVKELLEKANKINLVVLSITDHNTIDAYLELNDFNIRKLFKGNIIAGVELTTTYKGEVIEILGYCFDLDIMKDLITSTYYTFSDKLKKRI